ncbi:MAG: ATP synthase F1 subunit gamma, partial [Caldilineaceae bacterium]
AAKMRKAQLQVLSTRPYSKQAQEVLSYIARLPNVDSNLSPLLKERPQVRRVGVLLITADRGLAGGLNANMIREGYRFMRTQRARGAEVQVVTVGKKGRDWLLRYDPVVMAEFTGFPDNPSPQHIGPVTRLLVDRFTSGFFDEVYLAYTTFENTMRQTPHVERLLPVKRPEALAADGSGAGSGMAAEYIFEPSPEAVLNQVLYGFVEVQVLQAVFESIASEHSARMVAMRSATDAAGELIENLTLVYNKARQEGITNELMDIIGGSAAQEGAD